MAKKFGGLLVFGLAAGAAAAGVYHYLQTREKELADIDDFDDLDNMEEKESSRSYVNLDSVKKFAGEAVEKAKEVAKGAVETVSKTVAELRKEDEAEKDDSEEVEVVKDDAEEKPAEEKTSEDKAADDSDDSEDFFDDNGSEED